MHQFGSACLVNPRCPRSKLFLSVKHVKGQASPFPNRQILESSKLKDFADNTFNFDESGRIFSKRVENTEGKGEIARSEQFLLSPQCFRETCTADT